MKRIRILTSTLRVAIAIIFIVMPWAPLSAGMISPSGEIVFSRDDEHQSNIYRMNADGSNVTLVFKNTDPINSSSLYPHWSDDGKRILFAAVKDGDFRIFSTSRDGQDVRIEPGKPRTSRQSKWPDQLDVDRDDLYYTPPNGKRIKLYHCHAYHPKKQDDDGSTSIDDVSWGPDRKWVLFESCEASFRFSNNPCHIFIASADGKQHKDLGPGLAADWKGGTGDR